jgi:hypothetical protein
MPTNACQFFYDCGGCGSRLKPKPGDCCVFCSYGTVPCPPVQENGKGACCNSGVSGRRLFLIRPRCYGLAILG